MILVSCGTRTADNSTFGGFVWLYPCDNITVPHSKGDDEKR